jgi:hypothetical protein
MCNGKNEHASKENVQVSTICQINFTRLFINNDIGLRLIQLSIFESTFDANDPQK